MTIDERIDAELKRIKPELTAHEWFTLRDVLAAAFRRLLEDECSSPCVDNYCPLHGIAATRS